MVVRVIPVLLVSLSSVWAWQISGKVTDIRGKAIADAQVCQKGSTSNCVTTSATGTFSISGTEVGLWHNETVPASGRSFELAMRANKMYLTAPEAGQARIEWYNSSGRLLASVPAISLTKGLNRLYVSPSFSGVVFLRFSRGAIHQTWEISLGGMESRVPLVSLTLEKTTLSKGAAGSLPVLTASKTGFKSRNYYGINDTKDTLAWIILATTQDDTTFKFQGTSYPISAMPPNQLVNMQAWACYACPTAFGGKKVGYLGTKGSVIYGNVYAPKDSSFLVTVGYECANNDAHSDCSKKPGAKTNACRPIQFKVNNQVVPETLWTACEAATDWCHDLFDSIPIPLKAGLNSVELFTNIADQPDMDRLIVKDGRVY